MTRTQNWWHRWFLGLAQYVASASKDPSTQTGAVIVGPRREVVAVGYNGFPRGMGDGLELYKAREEKCSRIIHAEVNALMFAGRVPADAILYTWPLAPCDRCAVMMLQAGIRKFVAPPADPDLERRWNLDKAHAYIRECGGTLFKVTP